MHNGVSLPDGTDTNNIKRTVSDSDQLDLCFYGLPDCKNNMEEKKIKQSKDNNDDKTYCPLMYAWCHIEPVVSSHFFLILNIDGTFVLVRFQTRAYSWATMVPIFVPNRVSKTLVVFQHHARTYILNKTLLVWRCSQNCRWSQSIHPEKEPFQQWQHDGAVY